jgi:hypothetical protein
MEGGGHNITEILLKVASNTTILTLTLMEGKKYPIHTTES